MRSLRLSRADEIVRQMAVSTSAALAVPSNGRRRAGNGNGRHAPDLVRSVIAQAPLLIFAVDPDGVITAGEGGLLTLMGLRDSETVGLKLSTVYPAAADHDAEMKRALHGETSRTVARVAGRTLEVWYGPQRDAHGTIVGVMGIAYEITEANRELAMQTQQTGLLQRMLFGSSLEEQLHAIRVLVESVASDIECELLVPDPLLPPDEVPPAWVFPIVADNSVAGSVIGRPKAPRWPTSQERGVLALAARLAAIVIHREHDHGHRRRAVLRDPLTGLLSRAQLLRQLDRMLAEGSLPALLFCDVDRFKLINDSLGPDLGDRVLSAVAARMRSIVRECDIVARVGGDEFVVLLAGVTADGRAESVARTILARIAAPMVIDGRQLRTTVSIGVALPHPQDSAADLLSRGDIAMAKAKDRGRERYVVQRRGSDGNAALQRLELETQIRSALQRDELRLAFQPIVRCDNGCVASVEALLRWEHPDRGLLSPADFLPVAQDAGLLTRIDRWVLGTACRQAANGLSARMGSDVVSVNLAGLPFDESQIVEWILDDARAAGLAPEQLVIEVTEGMLGAESSAAVDAFRRLRSHGVRIAVDDFGTGYSSLHRLKSLPVDVLKVDRSFVADLGEEPEAAALLDAIVTMGHALGMEIVAEGVETATQLDEVRRLGCDMAQGDYVARPVPFDAL